MIPEPHYGRLTWDAEGQEGGPYHSRMLHVPSESSGATIGRGYDMKLREYDQVIKDFWGAGLGSEEAKKAAQLTGYKGHAALAIIEELDLEDWEISGEVQLRLFGIEYGRMEADVKRICAKDDVVDLYGATDWDNTDQAIRELIIDLRYRGDYTGATRRFLQRAVVANDGPKLLALVSDAQNWPNVPQDRFRQRVEHMERAYG